MPHIPASIQAIFESASNVYSINGIYFKLEWQNSSLWSISVRELETLSSTMTHLIRRRVLNYWDSVFPFGGILSLPSDQEEEKEKFWAVWLLPRSRRDDGSHMWKIWSMIWNYFLIFLILQLVSLSELYLPLCLPFCSFCLSSWIF